MDTNAVLSAVKDEISRLQKVVDLLEPQTPEPRPLTTKPSKKGHVWSQAQRTAMSAKLKASWKARQSSKKAKK